LFLDQSESMAYGHEGGMTKYDYAATAAASLAYTIQQQADSVGLNLFNNAVVTTVPPSNTRANLGNLFKSLEAASPTSKTSIGSVLMELSSQLPRRGMVLILSDLFDEPAAVLKGLRSLAQRGHDVVVFHILDRDEVEFPFERMTLFEGLEEMPELLVDPRSLRDAYLEEINQFQEEIRKGCLRNRIDYFRIVNSQELGVVLSSYLAARAAQAKRKK
ncbi:MAG: VWA domain-containing protein, partial [Planctomycetes bacterium]|nr:VWA domain-containing protein [Planctomycetota bacterium]